MKKIVVIGGYGHVGGQVSRQLAKRYSTVVVAGRSEEKALKFSQNSSEKLSYLSVDLTNEDDWDFLQNTDLVIICIDQTNTLFLERCLELGVDYLDISANYAFFQQLMYLDKDKQNSTAILGVGLAPGLTNLVAKESLKLISHSEKIDISILLGLGDIHGKEAMSWTIKNMNTRYTLAGSTSVTSFTGGKKIHFSGDRRLRKAYFFPFPDQLTLPSSLAIPIVKTRLVFDSRSATGIFAALTKLNLIRFLEKKKVKSLVLALFQKIKIGQPTYQIKIDAYKKTEHVGLFLKGKNEAQITADMAIATAILLLEGGHSKGIYQIDELFYLKEQDNNLILVVEQSDNQIQINQEPIEYGRL